MKRIAQFFVAVLLLGAVFPRPASAQPNSPDGLIYKSGYSSMMKLGKDIYRFLTPVEKELISSQPISIETDVTPFVRLLYLSYPDQPKPIRGVWISAGFIDLVNNVAHAKAIDQTQRGYFSRYIEILSQESGQMSLRPLPNDSNPAFWTEDMLNEQLSNFNSIVGTVVGIKIAQHSQGLYEKYKNQISGPNGVDKPINNLLTPKEWEDSFTRGVRCALDAGCTIEGVIPFFEAFDKMKTRPPWAAYFLPDNAKFSKLKKEMERIQKKFLDGE